MSRNTKIMLEQGSAEIPLKGTSGRAQVVPYVIDSITLDYVPQTNASSGSSSSVSVTNFPSTQAVSGTVSVSNFPATQPVSIATMPSTPVTGTFWPATQPVSGTVAVSNMPTAGQTTMSASQPVNIASDQTPITDGTATGTTLNANDTVEISTDGRGAAVLQISGTVTGATHTFETTIDNWTTAQSITGVQMGSVAAQVNATTTGMWIFNVSGKQKIRVKRTVAGLNSATINWRTGNGVPFVNVYNGSAANMPVTVTPPALTKGTQGSTGFTTQDLKDAGRSEIMFYATAIASGTTTTETAITLNKSAGTAATTSAASFVITSGKRFRITQIMCASQGNATATAQTTLFSIRLNAGAVTTASTPVIAQIRTATPATASAYDRCTITPAEGYEILGDGTLQIGVTAKATFTTNAPTWDVFIMGYEY